MSGTLRDLGETRATLVVLGEARVRHLLAQQLLVHHLIVPAHEWLTELDAERDKKKQEEADAAVEGQE